MSLEPELLEESVDCRVLERKEVLSCLFVDEMGNQYGSTARWRWKKVKRAE